jgi:hypothetical protein
MSRIAKKIAQLERRAPKHSRYGQLYRDRKETHQDFARVVLYTLFVSDTGGWLFRPHIFHKRETKTAREWSEWFSRHLDDIMKDSVLPGITRRTGLEVQWAVYKYIGWVGDVKSKPRNSAVSVRRNQTKKARRAHG